MNTPKFSQPPSSLLIHCPRCGKPSDSVKCFRMGTIIFIFIAWSVQSKDEVGCPSCIRRAILSFALINLISANVLWPFIILPMSVFHLIRSYMKGHSSVILKNIRPTLIRPTSGTISGIEVGGFSQRSQSSETEIQPAPKKRCPHCGKSISANASMCRHCHEPV